MLGLSRVLRTRPSPCLRGWRSLASFPLCCFQEVLQEGLAVQHTSSPKCIPYAWDVKEKDTAALGEGNLCSLFLPKRRRSSTNAAAIGMHLYRAVSSAPALWQESTFLEQRMLKNEQENKRSPFRSSTQDFISKRPAAPGPHLKGACRLQSHKGGEKRRDSSFPSPDPTMAARPIPWPR